MLSPFRMVCRDFILPEICKPCLFFFLRNLFYLIAVKERILELCQEQNISINKLCNMSGVTQSTVNNIISGRNRSATVSTIKKLCDGLGITIEEFFHSDLFKDLEQELK